ncbi:aminoacyl-tRNA hydrolase [Patescibacteria group bacterium]|nr:aminoacyl-tRNA hydrolase [Patescibacteria group bacterium]
MKLIVGLGNPGDKYESTRHNLGFIIVDKFLKNFQKVNEEGFKLNKKFKSEVIQIEWSRRSTDEKTNTIEKVVLVKPQTYMNVSGNAVGLISSFYKIDPDDIWIIHDDLDLPFGNLKIRKGGASAGHKGVESIIEALGTDKFWRIRVGIGNPHNKPRLDQRDSKFKILKGKLGEVNGYVLGKFYGAEKGRLREALKKTVKAIEAGLEKGIERAQNQYNTM